MGKSNVEAIYPLSPTQHGMLFHGLYAPGSGVYITQVSCTLTGDLDVERFKAAWQQTVDRHAALRTSFVWERREQPLQVVRQRVGVPWRFLDWQGLSPDAQQEARAAFLQADRQEGFDCSRAPLMRLTLIQVAENAYNFVWTHHHILLDGWSLQLILADVLGIYQALREVRAIKPGFSRPYADYIAWLQGQDRDAAEAYWRRTLQGVSAPTPLVVDCSSSSASAQDTSYAELQLVLPRQTTAGLQTLAGQHQVTLHTIVQGAWALLLSRYSGAEDVVFGVTVSGRPAALPGVESMVGLFINTVPVRVRVPSETELLAWLRNLQAQHAELRQFEHSPLVEIQGWSEVPRGLPLFESLLVFENYPVDSSLRQPAGDLAIEDARSIEQTNYPLTVVVMPGAELRLKISYACPRFDAATIRRMLGHLQTLLEGMIAQPARRLATLPMLPDDERTQLLETWNATRVTYTQSMTLHELIQAQVARSPDAVAVIFEGSRLTYGELDCRSNQLACYLRRLGVGPDLPVGLCLERSLELVVAILAVLKAGGAYLPLDPEYPAERLAFMAAETQAPVLLTQERLRERLPAGGVRALCLDTDWAVVAGTPPSEPPIGRVQSDNLAYIIYTSGSTGRPKGVMVPHRGIVNRLLWMQATYHLETDDRVLQKTPFSFDVSVWEFFWPLITGATLVIARPDGHRDPAYLVDLIRREQITTVHFVPPMLRAFLEEEGVAACTSLRRVLCSGEVLTHDAQERFFACLDRAELHNLYGPTEAAVDVTYWACRRNDPRHLVPIGFPVANTQMYVLDRHLCPVPVGVTGELHIGGVQLARGYLHRPELTAERFIPNPFSDEPGARLYRTGDRARYLPDGAIEYIGRLDRQVKIRGVRVEPDEIEILLTEHPAVRAATVLVVPAANGDHDTRGGHGHLLAYVELDQHPAQGTAELRDFLREKLPEVMVPSAFITVEALPLTPSGKVDRQALPTAELPHPEHDEGYAAPDTPLEEVLAGIWAEVLGRQRVGRHDDFFALGGHSLLATSLIARVRRACAVDLPLRALFAAPTVERMARAIAQRKAEGAQTAMAEPLPSIVLAPDELHLPFPLTDVQQAYWVGRDSAFELGNVGTHVYLELDWASFDLQRFTAAWQRLIERHPMLRAVVLPDGWQQILEQVPSYQIELADPRSKGPAAVAAHCAAIRERLSHQVFEPSQWPLFEICAVHIDAEPVRLHVSIDVLLADAWSLQILGRELALLYTQPQASLPPLELTFRDYVLADLALRDSDLYRQALAYWRDRLPTLPPAPELPLARSPAALSRPRFQRRSTSLESDRWCRLKARAAQVGLTPTGVVLAAFATVLGRWSKSARFTLNLTLFHRLPLHPQVQEIVGDFTSLTLLAVEAGSQDTFERHARRLQEQLWNDLDHRYVSGVQVLRELARAQGGAPRAAMPVVFTSTLAQQPTTRVPASVPAELVYAITQTPQVWLDHQVSEQEGALVLIWDAAEDLFPPGLLDDMFTSYTNLLLRLAEDPAAWQETRGELVPLPEAQRRRRHAANATATPLPLAPLQTLVATQAALRPDHQALAAEGRSLTYAQLLAWARRLGRHLRALGARPDTLVAVAMAKGWEQVVAALGVLEAGAAYLPLDPALPPERLHSLLAHGRVRLVLTQPGLRASLAWPAGLQLLTVEDPAVQDQAGGPLAPAQGLDDLAYVIYTSGSTGEPKGVMISHRAAANTLLDLNARCGIGPADRVLALSSLSFDLSVYDTFGTLAAGGTIVVPAAAAVRDPAAWARLLEGERVTLWNSVPALAGLLAEELERRPGADLGALRWAWLSGDWIPLALPGRLRALRPGLRVLGLGGATEAAIWSVGYEVGEVADGWASIPYGWPLGNQELAVLDGELAECPEWVAGDLYIGGAGLARGYWREGERTAASFVAGPGGGGRLYRTGDLARYWPDGCVEFLGREDLQVKVQGYRVELGEVEAALGGHAGVRAAVALATGPRDGARRLLACVVPASTPATDQDLVHELGAYLRARLPEYMIPSRIILLEALPLSANGKVDRKVLLELLGDGTSSSGEHTVHRAEKGRGLLHTAGAAAISRISDIVASTLNLERVDPSAHLLELGASSVDLIRLAGRLERNLDFRPAIADLYQLATIADLAAAYEAAQGLRSREQPAVQGQGAEALAVCAMVRDPQERAAFKARQPGVRHLDPAYVRIPLSPTAPDEALWEAYVSRSSRRTFAQEPILALSFSQFLGSLRQISHEGQPKYRYASAGGLYPVQTYLHLKAGAVEGLTAGTYYYHPIEHVLVALTAHAELDDRVHDPFINGPIFAQAAFSLFLIADLAAIRPMYGELAQNFCLLEAGYMGQLLMTVAPAHGIALCPVGTLDFARIRSLFALKESHVLVHSLLGGRIKQQDAAGSWSPGEVLHPYKQHGPPLGGERELGEI